MVEGAPGVVGVVTSGEIPAAPAKIGKGDCSRRISEERGGEWCEEIVKGGRPFIGSTRSGGRSRWSMVEEWLQASYGMGEGTVLFSRSRRASWAS